jgi:patatin-like phospholipase/acyl hydrolase
MLKQAQGAPVRLCDHFDLIGGTSTGGVIATALAPGYSAREVRDYYFRVALHIFRNWRLRLFGWQSKFDDFGLKSEISRIVGNRELGSPDLQTASRSC